MLRYFYVSVDVYSSVGVFGGSLDFVYAFEEFQLRLRAAFCLVDVRRPWKPCQTALWSSFSDNEQLHTAKR